MTRPLIRIREQDTGDERFARHRQIEGFEQERLRAARVAVFGVGALGNEVAKNLALVGIGHLLLVDLDRVEVSNLSRAVLFRAADCGRYKAEVAAERVQSLAPETEVLAIAGDLLLALGPARLETYDVAIGCLDSIDGRLGLDRLCRRAGVSWLNGGLGESACEVTRFDPIDGPCYACTLSARALRRELTRWSCQDGRLREIAPRILPTTATSAALGGALLVQEALSALMPSWSERRLPPGTRLLLMTAPHALVKSSVPRNPGCPFHEPPAEPERLIRVGLDHRATGRAILDELGLDAGARVEVHLGLDLMMKWSCECSHPHEPLVAARAAPPRCPDCGATPKDIATVASLAGDHAALDLPLARLGIPDGGELIIHDGEGATTVRLATQGLELPT